MKSIKRITSVAGSSVVLAGLNGAVALATATNGPTVHGGGRGHVRGVVSNSGGGVKGLVNTGSGTIVSILAGVAILAAAIYVSRRKQATKA